MDFQKEKEAFEAWFESRYDAHFMQFALDLDPYVDKHTQTCWEAWQAARVESHKQAALYQFEINHLVQANQQWREKAAKAQAVPEGCVVVEKKNTEDWYLDDCEGMWWDHDGIDGSLCELDIGEVQAVEHKEYLITENNTLYATRVWDDANDQVDCWQFFKTKEEAEKAAAYCKAKFYEEAQEPAND